MTILNFDGGNNTLQGHDSAWLYQADSQADTNLNVVSNELVLSAWRQMYPYYSSTTNFSEITIKGDAAYTKGDLGAAVSMSAVSKGYSVIFGNPAGGSYIEAKVIKEGTTSTDLTDQGDITFAAPIPVTNDIKVGLKVSGTDGGTKTLEVFINGDSIGSVDDSGTATATLNDGFSGMYLAGDSTGYNTHILEWSDTKSVIATATKDVTVNNPYIYTAPTVTTDSNSIFNTQYYSAGSRHYVEFTGVNASKITYDFAAVESGGLWANDVNDWITPEAGFSGDVGITLHVWDATTSTVASTTGTVTIEAAVTGPTITGPDTTTEGAATVQTGTLQDTITTQSLISGAYSIEQTIDSATATTLNYVADSGVNQCTPGTPVSGVPLEPTITAAGITPYVVQQEADDGTSPPATRNITLNGEATHEVIQTMAGVANTTPDQSIFGSTWVTVEDNHQARVPKVVDGVTFTWNDKGEFTTDIDKTVTFQYELFSPASGNWSAIDLTVRGTVILNRTFRVVRPKRVIRF